MRREWSCVGREKGPRWRDPEGRPSDRPSRHLHRNEPTLQMVGAPHNGVRLRGRLPNSQPFISHTFRRA